MFGGSRVEPEWHLKQSWYSRVITSVMPFRKVYVGAVPGGPFTTDTPETPARLPEASHPLAVCALFGVALALWELWQSAHSLCRLLTPPNSSSAARVCVLGARASCEYYSRAAGLLIGRTRPYWN